MAKALGFVYVNTGAMYRTLAWYCLKNKIDTQDAHAIALACKTWKHRLLCVESEVQLLVDDYAPQKQIRTAEVSAVVSYVAVVPSVREWMKKMQRQCVQFGNLVMEGRDIGTNIFPETRFKFYLDAHLEERSRRRAAEGIMENLAVRDRIDQQRLVAPLRIAPGAHVINNSQMTADQTSELIMQAIKRKMGESNPDGHQYQSKHKSIRKNMKQPHVTNQVLDFQGPELFGTPSEVIIEPVHKSIGFFRHEEQVIEHPLFQRLKFIYQSDVMSLVWPGATHSRFLHSIGTMHVASRIFKTLVRSHLCEMIQGGCKEVSPEQRSAIQYFHACIRLAALLHDTGHAPFSHQFEFADAPRGIYEDPNTFTELWDGVDWTTYYGSKAPSELDHEHYSVRCAAKILEGITEIEKQDVLGIMEKTIPAPSELFCNHAMTLSHLLSPKLQAAFNTLGKRTVGQAMMNFMKNIISGPIDADKMDYLLRDSHFSGCLTGVYDFDYLLNNLRIGIDVDKCGTPQIFLAINKKALGGLEDFFYSRFHMYSEIYSHKTYAGFKFILSKALGEVLSVPKNANQLKHALTDIAQFEKFTDAFFWEKFRQYGGKNPNSFCSRLLNGRKLEHIHEKRLPVADSAKQQQEEENVGRKYPGRRIVTWNEIAKFSAIKGPFKQLKLRAVDSAANDRKVYFEEVAGESPFIKDFKDEFKCHFYLID